MKYPAHLHTICINFGPNVALFQQHHADASRARVVYRLLRDKAAKAASSGSLCIEGLELWHQNKLVSSYSPNPPTAAWLPPPDANGVRHIPEAGRKRPKRIPSIVPSTAGGTFKLVL